jgi:hypothetical protein
MLPAITREVEGPVVAVQSFVGSSGITPKSKRGSGCVSAITMITAAEPRATKASRMVSRPIAHYLAAMPESG